jgi:bisphosphoglycerate-dependent phosphoglycerate mutase
MMKLVLIRHSKSEWERAQSLKAGMEAVANRGKKKG